MKIWWKSTQIVVEVSAKENVVLICLEIIRMVSLSKLNSELIGQHIPTKVIILSLKKNHNHFSRNATSRWSTILKPQTQRKPQVFGLCRFRWWRGCHRQSLGSRNESGMPPFFEKQRCKTGWWFQICLIFTPILGEMIQFDYIIFSDGLKPPTRKTRLIKDFHIRSKRIRVVAEGLAPGAKIPMTW